MSSRTGRRLLPLLVTAFALSACGGGGGGGSVAPSSTTPAGGNATASTSPNSGNVQLSITLPGTAPAAKARQPAFVSSGTAGVAIAAFLHSDTAHANPVGSTAAAVGVGAPGCSSSAPVTCLVPIGVPPSPTGNSDDFVITLYNQAPSGGGFSGTAKVLGVGTIVGQTVTNGSNSFPVSVLGVPASGVVLFPSLNGVAGGMAANFPLTATVLDASSNAIQGTFASPVQLTTDSPSITSFLVNGVPGTLVRASTDSVMLVYNGGTGSADLSLTGTAPFSASSFPFIPSSGAPTGVPATTPGTPLVVTINTSTSSFTVSEPNYTNAGFTESDNCASTTAPPTTISPTSVNGSTATFTVDAGFEGGSVPCTATIEDTAGQTISYYLRINDPF